MTNINKKHLAKEIPFTEKVFGIDIEDNYRYFEDTENQEALKWIKKQTKITKAFLEIDDKVEKIYQELLTLDSFQKVKHFSVQTKKVHIYYVKRFHNELKGKLYRKNLKTKKEQFLFDFDSLNSIYKGELQMQDYNVSPNEKYLSFIIAKDGNEKGNLHLLNLETITLEKDVIKDTSQFSAQWLDDDSFLYARYPNINLNNSSMHKDMELKFHRIGTDIKDDFIVVSKKTNKEIVELGDTNWFYPYYESKSKTLYFTHRRNTDLIESLYSVKFDIEYIETNYTFSRIISFQDDVKSVQIFDNKIYFLTSYFEDDYILYYNKIINFKIDNSKKIPLPKDEVFEESIFRDKDNLYCITIKNAYNNLYKIDFEQNKSIQIETEIKGSIYTSYTICDKAIFISDNLKTPATYSIIDSNNLLVLNELINTPIDIDLSNIVLKTEEYESHDGIKVPITYAYNKNVKLNNKNRCIVYAYGSYGVNYLSYFNLFDYKWINNGGVVAIAHVRGGGEKGKQWHLDGKKENKSNTWKDLISAGEFLIKKGFTSSPYLACEGASAGGITVGMTANERPDVFGTIISKVGSNNCTRLGRNPGGGLSEFGNPSIQNEFETLLKMDVFQNIKEQAYPNMLFTAGMKDDRVDYWQPSKACAKMQKMTTSNNRISLLALEKFGHGIGESRASYLKYLAYIFSFLDKTLK